MQQSVKPTKKASRTRLERGKQTAPRKTPMQWLRESRVPLALCGFALVVYVRSLFCGFVRDDFQQFVNNRQVQSWDYLPQLLGSHLWSQMRDQPVHFYRPLFSIWMLLMYTIGGPTAWFWHLSSILLHVAATYLVFIFCKRLTGSDLGSAVGAAIFAAHPIHVDAVSWISASCEVLCAICALVAMLMLLPEATIGNGEGQRPRIWLSALWFALCLFAKETGMVMLAILPVIAWVRLQGPRDAGISRLWNVAGPYSFVAAAYLFIRSAVLHGVGVELGTHSWSQVIFSAPSIFLFYLKKLFLPWDLSGSYVNPLIAAPTALFGLQVVLLLVSGLAIAWLALRYRSLAGFGAALIVIPILPALAVTRIYDQGDITHDRYLYLPSVGLSLLIALLAKRVWSLDRRAKIAATASAIAVIAAFTAETVWQQKFYQDDIAFYSRVIQVSPTDAYAMGMLGNVYLDQGRNDLALEQFRKADGIAPDYLKVRLFLARGLVVEGKYQEPEALLKDSLRLPLSPVQKESVLLSLANIEMSLGNLNETEDRLKQAGQIDDSFPELHWAWGMLYQKENLLPQALAEYQKEVDITGDELAKQRSVEIARRLHPQTPRLP